MSSSSLGHVLLHVQCYGPDELLQLIDIHNYYSFSISSFDYASSSINKQNKIFIFQTESLLFLTLYLYVSALSLTCLKNLIKREWVVKAPLMRWGRKCLKRGRRRKKKLSKKNSKHLKNQFKLIQWKSRQISPPLSIPQKKWRLILPSLNKINRNKRKKIKKKRRGFPSTKHRKKKKIHRKENKKTQRNPRPLSVNRRYRCCFHPLEQRPRSQPSVLMRVK